MTNKIFCASLVGTQTKIIEIESAFTRGLPNFSITGLATSSIQESKQRVQSALAKTGFTLPPLKITINLSPSDIAKSGSYFDLPIALILHSMNLELREPWFAFGELGLDGTIKYTQSIFPLLFDLAVLSPNANVIVPECAQEILGVIPNLCLHFAKDLPQALEILDAQDSTWNMQDTKDTKPTNAPKNLDFTHLEIDGKRYYYMQDFALDFAQVRGQEMAKRAALISAVGLHNIIFEGSPGCGKSMIAQRMRHILPPMSLTEIMHTLKLQSLSAQECIYSPLRPFRNPHQSASKASILGSATQFEPKPGEVALAHNGILFFDELPHFKRDILESLREPLENHKLSISRVHSKLEYETLFLFIGAQNPCPCGNLLSSIKECRCQEKEIKSYKNRLSEPFLDRIDIFVQMTEESPTHTESSVDSKRMQEMVFEAFVFAKNRGQQGFNGKLSEREIEQFCVLDSESQALLQQASVRFGLSMRAQNKLKKVARSIADLAKSEMIMKPHILEALSYRHV